MQRGTLAKPQPLEPRAVFLPLVVGTVFIALGVHTLLWRRRRSHQVASARRWPTASGSILESHLREPAGHDDDAALVFLYRYDAAGRSWSSRRIDLFGLEERIGREEMEAIVRRYPAGGQVTVHYNPDQPSQAVLEPDNRVASTRVLGLDAALLVAGALFVLLAARSS